MNWLLETLMVLWLIVVVGGLIVLWLDATSEKFRMWFRSRTWDTLWADIKWYFRRVK